MLSSDGQHDWTDKENVRWKRKETSQFCSHGTINRWSLESVVQTAAKQSPEQQWERKTRTWACRYKNPILFWFSGQAEQTDWEISRCMILIYGSSPSPYQVRSWLGLSVLAVQGNEDMLNICVLIFFLKCSSLQKQSDFVTRGLQLSSSVGLIVLRKTCKLVVLNKIKVSM